MVTNDPGDFDCSIDPDIGVLEAFLGFENFQLQGKDDVGVLTDPGGRAYGHEHRRSANVFTVDFSISPGSKHLDDLYDLAIDETEQTITFAITQNEDKYSVGEPKAFRINNAVITPGSISRAGGPEQPSTFSAEGFLEDPKEAIQTFSE